MCNKYKKLFDFKIKQNQFLILPKLFKKINAV